MVRWTAPAMSEGFSYRWYDRLLAEMIQEVEHGPLEVTMINVDTPNEMTFMAHDFQATTSWDSRWTTFTFMLQEGRLEMAFHVRAWFVEQRWMPSGHAWHEDYFRLLETEPRQRRD